MNEKIAYPKYQLFKNRLEVCLFKDVHLVHTPVPKSIARVKRQMEGIGLLCPMVLDLANGIRSGTNRYLELIRQGYDGSLFFKTADVKEAKFMQVVNVMTLEHHPVTSFDFIYGEDIFKRYGQDISHVSNLLKEHSMCDKRPLLGIPPLRK